MTTRSDSGDEPTKGSWRTAASGDGPRRGNNDDRPRLLINKGSPATEQQTSTTAATSSHKNKNESNSGNNKNESSGSNKNERARREPDKMNSRAAAFGSGGGDVSLVGLCFLLAF
jgi:hypothetical protein